MRGCHVASADMDTAAECLNLRSGCEENWIAPNITAWQRKAGEVSCDQ